MMSSFEEPQIETASNCWEYMHCPEDKRNTCPAFTQNSGGFCWLIAGTLCDDCQVHGFFVDKICDCQKCSWYQERVHGNNDVISE